jgi:hypothetical protein
MWQCEQCETLNTGETCLICGETKPIFRHPPVTPAVKPAVTLEPAAYSKRLVSKNTASKTPELDTALRIIAWTIAFGFIFAFLFLLASEASYIILFIPLLFLSVTMFCYTNKTHRKTALGVLFYILSACWLVRGLLMLSSGYFYFLADSVIPALLFIYIATVSVTGKRTPLPLTVIVNLILSVHLVYFNSLIGLGYGMDVFMFLGLHLQFLGLSLLTVWVKLWFIAEYLRHKRRSKLIITEADSHVEM